MSKKRLGTVRVEALRELIHDIVTETINGLAPIDPVAMHPAEVENEQLRYLLAGITAYRDRLIDDHEQMRERVRQLTEERAAIHEAIREMGTAWARFFFGGMDDVKESAFNEAKRTHDALLSFLPPDDGVEVGAGTMGGQQ